MAQNSAVQPQRGQRRPKKTRATIEAQLERGAQNNSIYSTESIPVELSLVTSYSQRMGEKQFYKGVLQGFHNIDFRIRLISKDEEKLDELVDSLTTEVNEILHQINQVKDNALAEVKKTVAAQTVWSHPHKVTYHPTTPMAMTFLTAVQNFDDAAALLHRLRFAGQISTKERMARINAMSGLISKLAIKVMETSRALDNLARAVEASEEPVVSETAEQNNASDAEKSVPAEGTRSTRRPRAA